MEHQDKRAFGIELGLLAEVLLRGESLSSARIEAYYEDLAVYPLAEVRDAIRSCRRSCVYFPAPAEIIETIRTARRARIDSTTRLMPAPPSEEERHRVHELIRQTIKQLEVTDDTAFDDDHDRKKRRAHEQIEQLKATEGTA